MAKFLLKVQLNYDVSVPTLLVFPMNYFIAFSYKAPVSVCFKISVICLAITLKHAVTVFISLYFQIF